MKILIAIFVVAAAAIACASSTTPSSAPTSPSPVASEPPSPVASQSPSAEPLTLTLRAQVIHGCGSIGGCTYFAVLHGPSGTNRLEFSVTDPDPLVLEFGPSEPLAPGAYQLTYTSQFVSDVVANGVWQMGPIDATCHADFSVTSTSGSLIGDGSFDQGQCAVTVGEI